HCSERGTSFFRDQQKAAATEDRLSAIVCRGWTTRRQWVSTLFIFRRFIRLVTPTAKAETTRSRASRAIRACPGRSAARPAVTKQSSLRSGRWQISTGFKNRYANAEWKSPSTLRLTAHPIILTSRRDRKSTRLNSSHDQISYAVFCLKKKTKKAENTNQPINKLN